MYLVVVLVPGTVPVWYEYAVIVQLLSLLVPSTRCLLVYSCTSMSTRYRDVQYELPLLNARTSMRRLFFEGQSKGRTEVKGREKGRYFVLIVL